MTSSTEAEPALLAMATAALPAFGLEGAAVEFVAMAENAVFKVASPSGGRYALRLHRPHYHSLEALESELAWTEALRRAGLPVPATVAATNGASYVRVEGAGVAEARFAGVVEWLDGETLRSRLPSPGEPDADANLARWYRELGAIAARMHNQATGWRPPAGFRRHRFDVDGFVGERPFWGRFWDAPDLSRAERRAFVNARRWLADFLVGDALTTSCYSLIHADLHPGNLLTNERGLWVLDFDDAGFGWHHYELAVALYPYADTPHYEAALAALAAGYRAHRALSDRTIELLPVFSLLRTLALIGRAYERPDLDLGERGRELIGHACETMTKVTPRSAQVMSR